MPPVAPPVILPRYYVPKGIQAPTHISFPGPMELYDGHGPDVPGGGCGGGRLYGVQDFIDGEPGWTKTDEGWWMNLGGCLPQHLIRLDTHPRIVRWKTIIGADEHHWWRVPVLLQPDTEGLGREPEMYVSALDSSWKIGRGWSDPDDLAAIQRTLLDIALCIGESQSFDAAEEELVAVVSDVLALGHHVSMVELSEASWLTKRLLLRTLFAASGLQLPEGAELQTA